MTRDKGEGFLAADAPAGRYEAIFEDDGATGYFYALDNTLRETSETPIVDAGVRVRRPRNPVLCRLEVDAMIPLSPAVNQEGRVCDFCGSC